MNATGIAELGFRCGRSLPETPEQVAELIKSGKVNYWTGPKGMEFEEKWAKWIGAKMAISCTNGTAALHIAIAALGIGPATRLSFRLIRLSRPRSRLFRRARFRCLPTFKDDHTIDPKSIESL